MEKERRNSFDYASSSRVIEASRGSLQLSVPMILIRLKGVAKQMMKRAMRIIV